MRICVTLLPATGPSGRSGSPSAERAWRTVDDQVGQQLQPPATVPSYMGVLVTSSVPKSGS